MNEKLNPNKVPGLLGEEQKDLIDRIVEETGATANTVLNQAVVDSAFLRLEIADDLARGCKLVLVEPDGENGRVFEIPEIPRENPGPNVIPFNIRRTKFKL